MADAQIVNAVREAWATALGVQPLNEEDNFFESGGDSLSALELVTILEDELGLSVPVAEMYRAPTLGALIRLASTEAVNGEGADASVSEAMPTAHHTTGRTLVRLRRGGSGRLWCFLPPLSGAVTRYAAMPRLLPRGDAIWAMETPAELSDGGMAHLVSGLAERLVNENLRVFETVVFSGYSLGGVFAHEVAKAVADRLGDHDPRVVAALLDPPDPLEFRPSLAEAFDIFVQVGWRIPQSTESFTDSDGGFALQRVAAAARAAGTLPASAPDREISDAWTVYASNAGILEGYVVTPGVESTYLLQCRPVADDGGRGWVDGYPAKGAWATAVGPERVSSIAVDHFALLEAPTDQVVGDWLSTVAEAARAELV